MRTKILLSVGMALGIAALILMLIDAADSKTVTTLLVIGLVCVTIEFIVGRKDSDNTEQ